MAEFIYVLRPVRAGMLETGLTGREGAALADHFAYLQAQATRGVVRLAGRTVTTGPETFGLVLFDARDEAAARSVMQNDPAVRDGIMTGEVWPFRVALGGAAG
jgi:uncharacterized protein YciI